MQEHKEVCFSSLLRTPSYCNLARNIDPAKSGESVGDLTCDKRPALCVGVPSLTVESKKERKGFQIERKCVLKA
jgi:hypothetical protein